MLDRAANYNLPRMLGLCRVVSPGAMPLFRVASPPGSVFVAGCKERRSATDPGLRISKKFLCEANHLCRS
jgi:hypothetical protein